MSLHMPDQRDRKELWLFTALFPKGQGEFSLEHELPHLCRTFSKVLIFPMYDAEGMRAIPTNAEVVQAIDDPFQLAPLGELLGHRQALLPLLRHSWNTVPSTGIFLKRSREVLSKQRQALARTLTFLAQWKDRYDPQRVVLYSNWAEDWAVVLGLWKQLDPRVHYVTRLRGHDLYDHRAPDNWQMFQRFVLENAQHIYTTSRAGTNDVLSKFPHMRSKLSISPTATVDHGLAPWEPAPVLRIASCSNLFPIKRIHLIAEALREVEVPVHWTHFGDGAERARIEAIIKEHPAHVSTDLKGAVPNAEVIAWYAKNPIDLFVHVSSTEGGVAVALQEAASFGIPLMGADAGGVPEIVTPSTGILLPYDVTPRMLKEQLEAFAAKRHSLEERRQGREFWSEHFNAERVHARFAADLFTR